MACLSSGCATLHLPWNPVMNAKATATNPAVQIVCLWEQADGRDPEGLPCRGFAGQILFLANRNATPVEIDGDVRIYLFDNIGTADDQSKPLRQFDFDAAAWNVHLTKSAVGPSYSVFVPYVRRGTLNAQCALRIRMEPKVGPTIFSELSSLPLKGPTTVPETTVISTTPEERVHAEVQQTLSRAIQGSTTIPITKNDNGGLAMAPRTAAKSPLVPAAATTPTDDRLARMEQLMQHMLEERRSPAQPQSPAGAIQQVGYETASETSNQEEPAPLRFKLDRGDSEE